MGEERGLLAMNGNKKMRVRSRESLQESAPPIASGALWKIQMGMLKRLVPREAEEAFRLDAIAGLLSGLYMGALFPFFGKIARDNLHASVLLISLMAAAPCIGPLLSPVWARQMSGKNKMPFAVWSWVIGRSLFLTMALITQAWAFVLVVSLVQIICSISTPAYSTLMKEIYPDHARGRCMGLVRVGIQAMTFLVALGAGRLLDTDVYAFHWVFPIAGLLGVAAARVFGRIQVTPIDSENNRAELLDAFRMLKSDPQDRWFAISAFTVGIGNLIAVPAMTIHQVDNLHILNQQISYLVNISALTAIFFYFFWGRYLDLKGPLRTVWVSVLLLTLIPLTYLFARDWRTLMLASLVAGITNPGIELSYINSILQFADEDRIPQYQSIHSFLFGVRGTVAPFLGGALIELSDKLLKPAHYSGTYVAPVFFISFLLIAAGALMQLFGVKMKYEMPPEPAREPIAVSLRPRMDLLRRFRSPED